MAEQSTLTIEDAFKQAMVHYQKGQLQPAVALFSKIIQAAPQHAHAHQMLGLIAFQTEQYEPAVKAMTEAVRLQPQNPQFLMNYVEVLRKAGNIEAAISVGKRAVQADPNNPAAHSNLGLAYYDDQNIIEAEASQQRALALNSDFSAALNNLGSIARDNGDLEGAVTYYRKALRTNPTYSEAANNCISVFIEGERYEEAKELAYSELKQNPNVSELQRNMGRIHLYEHKLDDAETSFRNAISLNENKAENYLGLSQVLYEKNHSKLALIEAETAYRLDPENPQICHQIAITKAHLGDMDAGFEFYEKALALNPDMTASRLALGYLKMENGDFDGARADFELAAQSTYDALNAQMALARMEKMTPDNSAFVALEAALPEAEKMPAMKAAAYHYALGKCYEDLSRYENAFEQYAIGAKVKRSTFDYDPAETDQVTDDIIALFDKGMIEKLRKSAISTEQPIFVLGMPRSGTTLTESILDSHSKISGAGELNYLQNLFGLCPTSGKFDMPRILPQMPAHDLTRKIEEYIESAKTHAPNTPYIVDKMPANFQMLGLIYALLPNAKIIHIARNPFDTCLSCFTRIFERSQLHSYDQVELGRYFNNYIRLMNHWHTLLPKDSFHTVHYENLVEDIDTEARRIIDFCGLGWEDACLEFYKGKRRVRTASVQQVRQPLYKTSKEKWKRYEAQLQPLVDIIAYNKISF